MRLITRWIAALALGVVAMSAAAQETFPSKRITIIVPYTAGGVTDVLARAIGEKIQASLGQPVIIENVAGASGTLAMARVAREPADGQTIFIGGGSNFIASLMMNDTYNPLKELTPVAGLAQIPLMLLVHPSIPATNVAEFIDYARANPGKLNAYTTGIGSLNQVAADLFGSVAKVQIVTVPYKGGAQAMPDLLSGRVNLAFDALAIARDHVAAGRLRMLAVTSKDRTAAAPQLPTLAESGMPDFEVVSWLSVFVKTGTDPKTAAIIGEAFRGAMATSDVLQRFSAAGYTANFENPDAMRRRLNSDVVKWREVIKEIDMKLR